MTPEVALPELAKVARRAGAEIMHWYRQDTVPTRSKSDASPVTAADMSSHNELMKSLQQLLPGIPVVSEEGGMSAEEMDRAMQGTYWLIDPLDGTRDFLAGTGEFVICIALMESGRPVVGCIMEPVKGNCYLGRQKAGAFLQSTANGSLKPIRCRPASEKKATCLVSRSHQMGEARLVAELWPESTVLSVGSALKYAMIASGKADISVRKTPTSLWDTAAAQALLEAAGGAIYDFSGRPLRYGSERLTNPPFVAIGDLNFPWRELVAKLA